MLRMTEPPTPAALPSSSSPEMSPVKPSPAPNPLSSGMEGQVEERCLEQVQTMVVGEVLKDVDTACKLLNIASGGIESINRSDFMDTALFIHYNVAQSA